mgnify:CR=1 FL=1
MAVRFYQLEVASVNRETANAVSITFVVPPNVQEMFRYKSGQYLTIRLFINGEEHRRSYSLSSSPALNEPMQIVVKQVRQGIVSQWLNTELRAGMTLDVYPPMGNFTRELNPHNSRHYVMVAGGSGITPILSLLKSALHIESNSVVSLVYANRSADSIIFANEIEELRKAYPINLRVFHVLEDAGGPLPPAFTGMLDEELTPRVIAHVAPVLGAVDAFVCGPEGLMQNVVNAFLQAGLPAERIHREYFTVSADAQPAVAGGPDAGPADAAEPAHPVARTVTIRLYGAEHTLVVEPGETILAAAQRENLDPPYACQIGACCTCRAKIITGKVVMDVREALSDEEIAEGYALTCQSHPLTDNVFADYDQ